MVNLPTSYQWLLKEPGPKLILNALSFYGTCEISGVENNPIILGWAKQLNWSNVYKSDEVPWCGLFISICAKLADWPWPGEGFRAAAWANWGNEADEPMLGDVLVFKRTGGGHVGLYVGEDKDCFHVLGGNQGDKVSIVRIDKARCVAIRRCPWHSAQPANVRPVHLNPTGAVSENEA